MVSADNMENRSAALIRAASQPIALVGLMGTGKSSIGRKLAECLNVPFVDADDEIELAAGMSIAEIFERFGEQYFRDGERRVIARLVDGQPKVIATGGGAFINAETRALIIAKTRSVWIDADIDILVERVSRRSHRPLLTGRDPREVLTELARERNPKYAEAEIHIRSDNKPHGETVKAIVELISA